MDKELANKLRYLKVDVLTFLHTLSSSDAIALDLEEISTSTSTAEGNLKGIISTLLRMKIGEESIIQAAGRDERGRLRWKINESIVEKNTLASFLEKEILGKSY